MTTRKEKTGKTDYMNELILRSRAVWIEDGEKLSKYFFLIWNKRNYVNITITTLITETGNIINDQKHILQEARDDYSKLYISQYKNLIEIV